MADKKKLKIIAGELRKASAMHKAQAEKIENMSKGPSMINIAGAVAGLNNQKKSTAVGSVSPHSHDSSKDNAQPIPPITPPMPDNITGNIGNNFKVQELGKNMFQGEEMANQFAQRQMDKPVMPPSPDPMGDQYGMQFNQPFAQKELKQKEAIENYIHEKEKIQEDLSRYQVPQVFHKPTKEIIYKQPRERIVKKMVPKEMTGLFVEQRVRKHEEKMEKPREMPRQVIRRVNMEGPLAQTKYRMPLEGVQDLQDMGAVKEDEKGQYVVNENPESVRDTLRFPQGTKHYSGNPYKEGQTIDETDYEKIVNKVNKN